MNSAEHGRGIGHPQKGQVLMQCFWINFGVNTRHLHERLDLGGESEGATLVCVVKRFHSKMVPGDKQTRRAEAKIANGESEHSVQALDAIRALGLVKVKHYFGVGFRNK